MNNFLDLSKFKTSSAGTTVESDEALLDIKYTFSKVGWFFITFFGTTQTPKEISFTCKQTSEEFEVLTDKKLIVYYMLYTRR